MAEKIPNQGGWFVYECVHGLISRSKQSIIWDNVHSDTSRLREQIRLTRFALTQEEFDHATLDELEAKYPLPENLRGPL